MSEEKWFYVTVINEPELDGKLKILASDPEVAKALFRECLQRTCHITEEPIVQENPDLSRRGPICKIHSSNNQIPPPKKI